MVLDPMDEELEAILVPRTGSNGQARQWWEAGMGTGGLRNKQSLRKEEAVGVSALRSESGELTGAGSSVALHSPGGDMRPRAF